jgi:hypothetical protein
VEDVGAIFVDMDPLHLLAIEVATHLRAFVDDQASFTGLVGAVGKGGSEKTGTNNQIVVVFHDMMGY